jgi:PTS system mannose-specific IID component
LGAALAIALLYYLSQSAWLAGLGFWTLYRPLVAGLLVGVILGDPAQGTRVGATINLAYLGFIATGGALPSDIALAGYVGTTLALVGGLDAQAAMAASLPVGMLGYLAYQLRMTLCVPFAHRADRCAARGDVRGLAFWNVVPGQALTALLTMVPCFIGLYYGIQPLADLLARLPAWVLGALGVVGGLLPALGIALSLSLLWHGWNPAWFVLGFVICALADVPLLPFTLLAAAVAYIVVVASDDAAPQTGPVAPATARPSALLTRRDLLHSWVIWLFFSHANYNYERWQGTGFAHAMSPVLRRLYCTRQELASALTRHSVYYNSEPNLGALTNGVVVALEEAWARGDELSDSTITAAKTALMGPVSALGDTLIQGTLAPTLLSVGIALGEQGNAAGPLLYVLAIAALVWGVGWGAFSRGYRIGSARVAEWLQQGTLREVLRGAEIVGSSVLGALSAALITISTPLTLRIGRTSLRLQQDVLDALMPQSLALALVLLYVVLLRRRISPVWLVLGTFVLGGVAHVVGLL